MREYNKFSLWRWGANLSFSKSLPLATMFAFLNIIILALFVLPWGLPWWDSKIQKGRRMPKSHTRQLLSVAFVGFVARNGAPNESRWETRVTKLAGYIRTTQRRTTRPQRGQCYKHIKVEAFEGFSLFSHFFDLWCDDDVWWRLLQTNERQHKVLSLVPQTQLRSYNSCWISL